MEHCLAVGRESRTQEGNNENFSLKFFGEDDGGERRAKKKEHFIFTRPSAGKRGQDHRLILRRDAGRILRTGEGKERGPDL